MIDIVIQLAVKALTKKVKLSGTRRQVVTCEHCAAEYCFNAKRIASASAFIGVNVMKRARAAAEEKLQKQLATVIDKVSCPVCGHLQSAMMRKTLRIRAFCVFLLGVIGGGALYDICDSFQNDASSFGQFCQANFYSIQISYAILIGALTAFLLFYPYNSSSRCAKRVANPHQRGILRADWIAAEQIARDAVVQLHAENTQ